MENPPGPTNDQSNSGFQPSDIPLANNFVNQFQHYNHSNQLPLYSNQYQYWGNPSGNTTASGPVPQNRGNNPGNWNQTKQFSNPGPFLPNPSPQGSNPRHSLPVSKWPITKYDGEDQGLKLNEFLEIIQAFSMAEHASEVELFESAVHLFRGPALQWYMTMRSTGRLLNWQHLVLELKRSFMHPDLDALIKMKVYQRRPQRNETFLEFYHEMGRLFRKMSLQLPDYEKVQILLQNIRIDYKKQLNFLPITDLVTLVAAGQKVDALNFSAYNKVFGNEKSVSAVENTSSNKKGKRDQQPNTQASPPQQHVRNAYSSNQPQNPSNNNRTPPARAQQQMAGPSSASRANPQPTLEDLIDSYRPTPPSHCLNCGKYGHRMPTCRVPKGVLCEICGFRDYPTNNCPFCIKNGMAANESRRPPSS